jgi:hypothetical protein
LTFNGVYAKIEKNQPLKQKNMSLLQYLQLQPVDPDHDDDSHVSDFDDYQKDETISLKEDINPAELEAEWTDIVDDLEKDPNWFSFDDD